MKKTALLIIILTLVTGLAYAKDFEFTRNEQNYNFNVKIDKNPPVVGDNNITIEIKDPAGKIVTNANVRVDYSMPPMPGMPPMNYKSKATVSGNAYKAKLNFSMAGSWDILIKMIHGGAPAIVKFNVDVH